MGMTLGIWPVPSRNMAQNRATTESTPARCSAGASLATNGSYSPT
jgi:hypothetical protein